MVDIRWILGLSWLMGQWSLEDTHAGLRYNAPARGGHKYEISNGVDVNYYVKGFTSIHGFLIVFLIAQDIKIQGIS